MFRNILTNAIDAIAAKAPTNSGTIHIQTGELESEQVGIAITDNGGGIEPAIQSKIFDPFFFTQSVGKGTELWVYTR